MTKDEAIPEFQKTESSDHAGDLLVSHDDKGREYVGGTIERPEGSVLEPEEFDESGGDFPRDKFGNRVFGATLKS